MTRTLVLRALGLLVAIALGAVATQLVLYGLAAEGSGPGWPADLASWVGGRLTEGAAVLVGVAVAIVAAWTAWMVLRPRRRDTIRLARGRAGSSALRRRTLAESLERSLRRSVHPQVVVETKGRRLVVDAPVRSLAKPMEFVDELAAALPGQVESRGLSKVRYRVTSGKRTKKRVR